MPRLKAFHKGVPTTCLNTELRAEAHYKLAAAAKEFGIGIGPLLSLLIEQADLGGLEDDIRVYVDGMKPAAKVNLAEMPAAERTARRTRQPARKWMTDAAE